MKKVKIERKQSERLTAAQVQAAAESTFDYTEMYSPATTKAVACTQVGALLQSSMWTPLSHALLYKDASKGYVLDFKKAGAYFSTKIAAQVTPGAGPTKAMTASEFRKGALAATRQCITGARAALGQNPADAVALEALSVATEILAKHGWAETPKKRKVQEKKNAEDQKNQGQAGLNQSSITEVKPDRKPDAEKPANAGSRTVGVNPAAGLPAPVPEPPKEKEEKPALNGEFLLTGNTYPVYAKLRELGEGHYDKARTVWVFPTKEKAEKGQKIVDDYAAQRAAKAGAR